MQPPFENPYPPDSWLVEHNGEQLALLYDIQDDEMFWVRCRIRPLTSDPARIALLHSAQFWDASPDIGITYRNAHTRQIAPYAHAGGGPHYLDDQCRILIRGLYIIRRRDRFYSLLDNLLHLILTRRLYLKFWLVILLILPVIFLTSPFYPPPPRNFLSFAYPLYMLFVVTVCFLLGTLLGTLLDALWNLASRYSRILRIRTRLLLNSFRRP